MPWVFAVQEIRQGARAIKTDTGGVGRRGLSRPFQYQRGG
jgi:hypothetical protein